MSDSESIKELRSDVEAYADAHKGRIYAPIRHPAFADVPSQHGSDRWDLIAGHIPASAKTALDIGSHWGYFAHCLEDQGLDVVAAELSPSYLDFLDRIKAVSGKRFEVFRQSVFELPDPVRFDVVVALNIFHHFIKDEAVYGEFVDFLHRLDCEVLFFQAHDPAEGQMAGAYRNFAPDDFAAFITEEAGLSSVDKIGAIGRRPVYALR
jgi:2-polyprenyl-3-methyl-5-hydroxy-6-metoxy-1,4-benzoquinol methylase